MEPSERRRQILMHAAELFGNKGFHSTSIADIIDAAGIARGTFYLYFANKRAIFDELLDELLRDIASIIEVVDISESAPSAREQLVTNLVRVFELLTENRAFLSILLEGAVGLDKGFADKLAEFYTAAAQIVQSSLDHGIEIGLVRPCDTRCASLAVIGMLKEILHDTLRSDGRIADVTQLATEVLDLVSRGVLAEGVRLP